MAETSRKEDPPPRPPAPRLSINKGRQHSTGSIAIRFNASSLEDEWDSFDQMLPAESSNSMQIELGMDAQELMKSEAILKDEYSKSAPASEVTTPDRQADNNSRGDEVYDDLSPTTVMCITNQLRAAQNQPPLPPPPSSQSHVNGGQQQTEKSSFISGIKERFQDPLNAIKGKIEEFSDKRGILDGKKLRRPDPLDSKCLSSSSSAQELNGQDALIVSENVQLLGEAPPANGDKLHSNVSPKNNGFSPMPDGENLSTTESDISESDRQKRSSPSRLRPASFDMGNDYYPEPAVDFVGTMSVDSGASKAVFPKSCSLDAISRQAEQPQAPQSKDSPKKIKTTLKKLIKPIAGRSSSGSHKSHTAPPQPMSMTMSGLLSNKDMEIDEASNSENDQFYDLQDDQSSLRAPAKQPTESMATGLGDDDELKESIGSKLYPSKHKLLAISVGVLAYLVVPLPTYMAGMVFGAFLATVAIFTYLWWTAPPTPREAFILPPLDKLPPLVVPEMRDSTNDEDKFKGWMNELKNYKQEEYHISQTYSVLVHLEGTKLRLQTPKHNIPRRAMWDEPKHYTATFIKQRHADLVGCTVELLPPGLVKKRLWSKKYPICLTLPQETDSPSHQKSTDTTQKIYLFARSARDKEDWYRRFVAASQGKPLPTRLINVISKSEFRSNHRRVSSSSSLENLGHRRQGSTDSNVSDPGRDFTFLSMDTSHEQRLADYLRFMARVIPSESQQRLQAQAFKSRKKQGPSCLLPSPVNCEPQISWVNALITRCFWDFLREKFWINKIKEKIQKKLSKIHVPHFIDVLTVTSIELGTEMPIIRRASKPYVDDRGLWIDLDVAYTGGFWMSLETKCNLMKLTKSPAEKTKEPQVKGVKSPVTDSDEEDSAESSTDEEGEENVESAIEERPGPIQGGGASRKILRFVDKLSQSKYFQKATEYKYIKKAMEGVSNTRLLLKVELKNIAGPLAINVPPPPTDRLWYGFRKNPRLWLSAKPWVGEREVSLSHITDWIERKLEQEFQRVFVMPNMDDVPIPLMCDHIEDKLATPLETSAE